MPNLYYTKKSRYFTLDIHIFYDETFMLMVLIKVEINLLSFVVVDRPFEEKDRKCARGSQNLPDISRLQHVLND